MGFELALLVLILVQENTSVFALWRLGSRWPGPLGVHSASLWLRSFGNFNWLVLGTSLRVHGVALWLASGTPHHHIWVRVLVFSTIAVLLILLLDHHELLVLLSKVMLSLGNRNVGNWTEAWAHADNSLVSFASGRAWRLVEHHLRFLSLSH